jgi:hypothetical protein
MKRIILSVMALLFFINICPAILRAEDDPIGTIGPDLSGPTWLYEKRGIDTLKTFWQFILRLEVTSSQKSQIKPLYNEQQQQAQEINNSILPAREKQMRLSNLNREIHKKVLEKLTPVQREKLQSMPGFQP